MTLPKPAPGKLTDAVEFNNIEEVKDLLRRGANPNEKSDGHLSGLHASALMLAIYWATFGEGNEVARYNGIARLLIEAGADVNAVGSMGWTPLISAVLGHNTELVRLLLDNNADINVMDHHAQTALMYATDPEVRQMLKEEPDRRGVGKFHAIAVERQQRLKQMIKMQRGPS